MRAVDYVTNGFGGVVSDIVRLAVPAPTIGTFAPPIAPPSGPSGPSGLQYAPVETKMRVFLESLRLPQYIVEAAIQTYRTRGVAGLIQAKNFGEALGPAAIKPLAITGHNEVIIAVFSS